VELGPRPLEGVAVSGPSNGYWRERSVFVTGATGLVGSWLVRELVSAGARVTALVRDWDPQSELIRSGLVRQTSVVSGPLEDYATLERALADHEIDTVFHLAAQTIVGAALRNPLGTFETNIRGTYNLLEACRRHRDLVGRVVVASSDKAYGSAGELPYTETMPTLGRYPYDVSKACADLIAQSYYHSFGVPVAVARCGNIYGGGDLNWSRVVPGTIRSLHFGQRPEVRSDGSYTRDYVYVEDAVAGYLRMGETLDRDEVRGEAFNFGPSQPHTVRQVVATLQRLMGREDLEPEIRNGAQSEIRHQYLCSEKAQRVLEWRPRYTLEQGLSRSLLWYHEFFGRAA
jgi:CDP-glucose 4,6-dehydratase